MTYSSNNFNISGRHAGNRVFLTHQILGNATSTRLLPSTISTLEEYIPTIFENECFNGRKLPFRHEAENTEVGHLLEHLILENLKILSEEKYGDGDFRGSTSWNWHKDSVGKFEIVIYAKNIEEEMFASAFASSVALLDKIFESDKGRETKLSHVLPRPRKALNIN